MKTEKGIVAVVFRDREGKKEFLILHRTLHWTGWELLKGHSDEGETQEQTVKRELFEETGVKKFLEIKKLPAILSFFDSLKKTKRKMQGFLVKADAEEQVSFENSKVKEHDAFEWVDAPTALKRLTYRDQNIILESALKTLKKVD